MDFFARLPIDVLHRILSSLTSTSKQPTTVRSNWSAESVYTKEDVQTCIVSKTFLNAWSTLPDLNFCHYHEEEERSKPVSFYLSPDFNARLQEKEEAKAREKEKFVNYLNHTLTNYLNHNIPLRSLRVTVNVDGDTNFADFIDEWIHKFEEYGVNEIYLDLKSVHHSFDLLRSLFSLKKLVSLKLSMKYQSGLFTEVGDNEVVPISISCSSLKTLVLGPVRLNQLLLDKLYTSCPLIEQLQFHSCFGPRAIKVANLLNLKCLMVTTIPDHDQTVHIINAPSLETLIYCQSNRRFSNYLPTIEFTRNLKGLYLQNSSMRDGDFHDLIANCLALEVLILDCCSELEFIEVSSQSLCFLRLATCLKLREVKIDAPNLTEFEYFGRDFIPSLAFSSGDPQNRKSSVTLSVGCLGQYFLELREFLKAFKSSDKIWLIADRSIDMIGFKNDDFNDLRDDNSVVPEFEVVFITVATLSSLPAYSNLMERLLACICPKILAVKKHKDENFPEYENFADYLCRELLLAEDDNPNCFTRRSQSWRNYFSQAKLEGRDEKWRPLHSWKNMEDVLENVGDRFILKLSQT